MLLARRPGFTLVEMLVVLGVLLVLAAIVVSFVPGDRSASAVDGAASQIRTALDLARQWALRDGAPRGLRIGLASQPTTNELVFLEQPDNFAGPPGSSVVLDNGVTLTSPDVDFTDGHADVERRPIQVGDFLRVDQGAGNAHLFRVKAHNGANLELTDPDASPWPANVTFTNYAFIRQPRPKTGERPVSLPRDVVIDLQASGPGWYPSALPQSADGQFVQVMFAPSGELMDAVTGDVIFWLRDGSREIPAGTKMFAGPVALVRVRGANVGVHAVKLASADGVHYDDPYAYARAGGD